MKIQTLSSIKIRPFKARDLEAALDLINRSDSTNRSVDTWKGNSMTAMLAFDQGALIGIIPFEQRTVVMSHDQNMRVLWASGVHVDPTYRGKGIGTKMDEKIKESFYPDFKGLLVCREDETSPAYRWYAKLGYKLQTSIVSLKINCSAPLDKPDYKIFDPVGQNAGLGKSLLDCFQEHCKGFGGFCQRYEDFWHEKPRTHYYRKYYDYQLIAIAKETGFKSYAYLGKTDMRDGVERFDILEWVCPEDDVSRQELLQSVLHFAVRCGLKEVRIQFSQTDPHRKWFLDNGFIPRWRTNILGKMIGDSGPFPKVRWRTFQMDYI